MTEDTTKGLSLSYVTALRGEEMTKDTTGKDIVVVNCDCGNTFKVFMEAFFHWDRVTLHSKACVGCARCGKCGNRITDNFEVVMA